MAEREYQDKYEDPVNRTFRLYISQIREACKELKEKYPTFGNAEIRDDGISGINFYDVKRLEDKVRELTKDSKAKLMRNPQEWLRVWKGLAIFGIVGSIFFLSSNITGNTIVDMTTKTNSFLGAGLLIVGLVAGFFWLKNRK